MKFLLDENVSPLVGEQLRSHGHDAMHVREHNIRSAPDAEVLSFAVRHARVINTADSDFGDLLARTAAVAPSVLFLRGQQSRRADEVTRLILENLPEVESALLEGAIVVMEDGRLWVPALPFGPHV